jgi:hypothetical protein
MRIALQLHKADPKYAELEVALEMVSAAALAYRHIRHFIPLLIQHLDREASILTGLRKLFGNPGGMSPRRFCARKFLSILIFEHAAV